MSDNEMVENSDEMMGVLDGEVVSLADLCDVDLSEVEATYGFEAIPDGLYEWQNTSAQTITVQSRDKVTGESKPVIAVMIEAKVIGVQKCKLPEAEHKGLIGKTYRETRRLGSLAAIKAFKGLATSMGVDPNQKIGPIVEALATASYSLEMGHQKSGDKLYNRFVMKKPKT